MTKYVRYSWSQFFDKMDWEGTEYMMNELDPKAVPKELQDAHEQLVAAKAAWDEIIEEHRV